MTAKQPVVLGALRDAQHEHDNQAVSAGQIAAECPAPWTGRVDLVTQALWLLHAHGLVLIAAGSMRAWKITAAGRLMLAPRRGPARERPVIGGGSRMTSACSSRNTSLTTSAIVILSTPAIAGLLFVEP